MKTTYETEATVVTVMGRPTSVVLYLFELAETTTGTPPDLTTTTNTRRLVRKWTLRDIPQEF